MKNAFFKKFLMLMTILGALSAKAQEPCWDFNNMSDEMYVQYVNAQKADALDTAEYFSILAAAGAPNNFTKFMDVLTGEIIVKMKRYGEMMLRERWETNTAGLGVCERDHNRLTRIGVHTFSDRVAFDQTCNDMIRQLSFIYEIYSPAAVVDTIAWIKVLLSGMNNDEVVVRFVCSEVAEGDSLALSADYASNTVTVPYYVNITYEEISGEPTIDYINEVTRQNLNRLFK